MDSRLLWGALDMLILEVIGGGPTWGYAVAQVVLSRSAGYFDLKEGSLYPALHRLERKKLLSSCWQEADGRRRKYYQITARGQQALAGKRQEWREFAAGVDGVLGVAHALA